MQANQRRNGCFDRFILSPVLSEVEGLVEGLSRSPLRHRSGRRGEAGEFTQDLMYYRS